MAKLLTSLVAPFSTVASSVVSDWNTKSTFRTRLVDALCLYSAATALVQLVYVVLVGTTFPFNSFLSSFICHVGLFSLGASLRLQLTSDDFKNSVTPERAYAEFSFCALTLFFIVFSFMG